LKTAEIQRKTIDIDRLADALLMHAPDNVSLGLSLPVGTNRAATGDLVAEGIALVAALLR